MIQALISAWGSSQAANAQAAASKKALKFQKKMYRQSRRDMEPWLEAGKQALATMQGELGDSYEESEGYKFAVQEGEKAALSNLSALGMSNSGQALKALTQYRMGLASQDYGTWYNRQAGLAGAGQTQSSNLASLGQNAANQVGQQYNNIGAARASGYVGVANAINDGIDNIGYALGGGMGGGGMSTGGVRYGGLY